MFSFPKTLQWPKALLFCLNCPKISCVEEMKIVWFLTVNSKVWVNGYLKGFFVTLKNLTKLQGILQLLHFPSSMKLSISRSWHATNTQEWCCMSLRGCIFFLKHTISNVLFYCCKSHVSLVRSPYSVILYGWIGVVLL